MGANSQTQYPASADQCPADFPVNNCRSALLYPRNAPLANSAAGQGTWDFRATWVHVPGDRKTINRDTILVYFHGHTNAVKVDENGNCAKPDWASNDLFTQIQACAPTRYQFASMADNAASLPIFLVPEVADPVSRVTCVAGRLAKTDGLARFIEDCLQRLALLNKHPACGRAPNPYMPPAHLAAIKRILVTAHSGGGIPLQGAAKRSKLFQTFPADLVMLDCLYGHDGSGLEYCTFRGTGPLGMGNLKDQSRLIVTTTGKTADGGGTEASADALIAALVRVLGMRKVVVAYDARTKLPILTSDERQAFESPASEIVEIRHLADNQNAPSRDNTEFLGKAMKNRPVVYIHTNVTHDRHPNVFIPLALASAPG